MQEYNILMHRKEAFMAQKVYPDWVQKQRTKGTTVKKNGDNYYLYKHSSRRVPGKKNPVPVDTYIGRITPNGVEKGGRRKVDLKNSEIIVREYGFSRAVEFLCTDGWKEALGDGIWERMLPWVIFRESPESYIQDRNGFEIDPGEEIKRKAGIQKNMLSRRIAREYGINLDDLKILSTIYLVTIGKNQMISRISDQQKILLDRLGIRLEVS